MIFTNPFQGQPFLVGEVQRIPFFDLFLYREWNVGFPWFSQFQAFVIVHVRLWDHQNHHPLLCCFVRQGRRRGVGFGYRAHENSAASHVVNIEPPEGGLRTFNKATDVVYRRFDLKLGPKQAEPKLFPAHHSPPKNATSFQGILSKTLRRPGPRKYE